MREAHQGLEHVEGRISSHISSAPTISDRKKRRQKTLNGEPPRNRVRDVPGCDSPDEAPASTGAQTFACGALPSGGALRSSTMYEPL